MEADHCAEQHISNYNRNYVLFLYEIVHYTIFRNILIDNKVGSKSQKSIGFIKRVNPVT